jgi:hypothetical protein
MNGQTRITVRRETSYPDRLRAYKVLLDDAAVATVRAGGSVTIPIAPGEHRLEILIDWCGSEALHFEALPEEHVAFACGSNMTGWRALFGIFFVLFSPRQYLWLRKGTTVAFP